MMEHMTEFVFKASKHSVVSCGYNSYNIYLIYNLYLLSTNEHLDYTSCPLGIRPQWPYMCPLFIQYLAFNFFMEIHSWVGLLDHTAVLIFCGNSILFSIKACNSLHCQQECIRVPIYPYPYQTCYCLLIHIAHHRRFQFVFPYWLVTLSILSHVCWPFVYFLCRNVYSIPSLTVSQLRLP